MSSDFAMEDSSQLKHQFIFHFLSVNNLGHQPDLNNGLDAVTVMAVVWVSHCWQADIIQG
jgi:hypothetical protein